MSMLSETAKTINEQVKQYEEDGYLECVNCGLHIELETKFCPECSRRNDISILF